jgi:alpha-mannosidase
LGRHEIAYALRPHVGAWHPSDATREGYDFNVPLNVVSTGRHAGELPTADGLVEIRTPNVILSGLKRAEDNDDLILRVYETDGEAVTAAIRIDERLLPAGGRATPCDLLERPTTDTTASLSGGLLCVEVLAYGISTVRISNG